MHAEGCATISVDYQQAESCFNRCAGVEDSLCNRLFIGCYKSVAY